MKDSSATDLIGGYRVLRREPLPMSEGTFVLLEHARTGASHIHIETADDNNGFAVVVPTVPQDSTGVAHILEHVVLAGSRRYPVRDPFFSMTRRSLATYMNALTAPDCTIYLFSTRNARDFANLLSIYLDAVYFPILSEDAFRQEGVRFEFDTLDDPRSGLRFKGVVFNEMKGALASPQAAVGRAVGRTLFSGLTYEFVSGGDPEAIPDLTWDRLRRFHAVHYHPSNSRFFTYGDQALAQTLNAIEERALSRFTRAPVDTSIPNARRLSQPVTAEETYPFSPQEETARRAEGLVAWLTVPSADSYRVLSMRVLADALLSNAGSPLRKALIDSKLGSAMADGSGFQDDYHEAIFGAGLKGIEAADAGGVLDVTLAALAQLAARGIEKTHLDGAIHRLEFDRRERSNAGWPYALKVLFACLPQYRYGGDPYTALNFDADLARLLEDSSHPGFFEQMIRDQLLDNPHRALLTIRPDPSLEEKASSKERARLATAESSLTEADKSRIVVDAIRLKADQDKAQDLASLPTLELTDIPMRFEEVPVVDSSIGGLAAEFYPQPTNGITYLDLRADFSGFDAEEQALLPLFGRVLTHSGAAGQDYSATASRIATVTGGVGAAAQVQSLAAVDDYLQSFVLSGRALDRNAAPFLELIADLVLRLELEAGRVKDVIGEMHAQLEGAIGGLAFQFAMLGGQSRLSSEGAMNDRLQGVPMLRTMRRLAELDDAGIARLQGRLDSIRARLFTRSSTRLVVTCEESMVPRLKELLGAVSAGLPAGPAVGGVEKPAADRLGAQARTAPVPVAFNVRVFKTVRYTHPDSAPLLVLSNYLRDTFLHREVREKGGAYGAYAQAGIGSGTFILSSYRDPNIARTYAAFDRAIDSVTGQPIAKEPLKEAILGACGDIDPLESPDIKGRRAAANRLTGFTLEARERFKRRLLTVAGDDLVRVANSYLRPTEQVQSTVAGADAIEAARHESPGLFERVEAI